VTIAVSHASSKAVSANGGLSFEVALQPGQAWHACLLFTLEDGEQQLRAPTDCFRQSHKSRHSETMADWLATVVKIQTSNEEFYRLFHQALEDMAALRLPIKGTDHIVFLPAAGLPWFVAPFGRDSLIVSLQNVMIYPEFARGALEFLGSLQAKEDDPYRDAEPGKILHELRFGELAHFKLIPHTPCYGTADATPLYLLVGADPEVECNSFHEAPIPRQSFSVWRRAPAEVPVAQWDLEPVFQDVFGMGPGACSGCRRRHFIAASAPRS
jgi:hypothetical protein